MKLAIGLNTVNNITHTAKIKMKVNTSQCCTIKKTLRCLSRGSFGN